MNSNNFKQNPGLKKIPSKTENDSSAELLGEYSFKYELNGESYFLLVQELRDEIGKVRYKFIHNDKYTLSSFRTFVDCLNRLGRRSITLSVKEGKLVKMNIVFKVVDGKLVFFRADEPSIKTLTSYYDRSVYRSKDDSNEES